MKRPAANRKIRKIRKNRVLRIKAAIGALAVLGGAGALRADPAGNEAPAIDFFRDVQPLLSEHCTKCHGGVKRKGGISYANRHDAFVEADSGAIPLVPGDLERSALIQRVTTGDADDRMPPDAPLEPEQIEVLKKWVAAGADWPVHWALQPVAAGAPPEVRDDAWPAGAIDRFVLARLEAEGLRPSPEADRRTLLRRVSLDLIGLLPTPREVEDFLNDPAATDRAFGKVVARLLASPHFGERWGRHWLDEARYADSEGYEKDSPRDDAYRWRDWVIRAINDDMPFDRFTVAQIAGDLLPGATDEDRLATAFHLMTQFNLEGGVDAEEDRIKRAIDCVNTVGSVWLGSSIGCAQCHDHPYDPLMQREFYQLLAFFNNADYEARFIGEVPADAADRIEKRREKWEPLARLLDELVTNNDLSVTVQSKLTQLRSFDNANGFTRVVVERGENRRKNYVFRRGDFLQPLVGDGEVAPGVPAVWPALAAREGRSEADRLDLARWLVDARNPLTARVTVNKVWLHLFGRPLAPIPQDFGARGEPPTHPELLDWLAHRFAHEARWSRKELVREIVMSAAYRQSSRHRPDLAERDPDNRLLARQNRFRVESEIVRDLHLQAAGLLSRKIGGASVFPPIPEDVAAQSYANNFKWQTSSGEDRYRRGIYTFFKRTAPDPNLVTFDCPDASISIPMRESSNSPLQALAMLQNEVYVEASRAMARNLVALPGEDAGRLDRAFLLALGRPPAAGERGVALELLKAAGDHYTAHESDAAALVGEYGSEGVAPARSAAWIAAVRIILNLDEFITRE